MRNSYQWTQTELQQFMDHYLPLDGQVEKTSETDAGTTRYSHIDPAAFSSLREATATLIEAKAAKR